MKKLLTAMVLGFLSYGSFAQQDPQLTHFMFDKLSVNPGFAGLNNAICGTFIYRQQWAGFEGSPQTALINVHAPVKVLRGGLGLTYFNDQLGNENNNIARLSYSYHLEGLGPGTLGIGASAGIVSKRIGATWVTPDTPAANDNAINDAPASDLVPDFSFGLFYNIPGQMYVGLSATHLSESDLASVNIKTARHYWIMAGYDWNINPIWTLKPSLLAKSDASSTQLDLNCSVMYNKMIWAGLTYRVADAVAPMLGYQTDLGGGKLKIGLGYDVTTSQLRNYSNGSYELMLNYCFSLDKPQPVQKYKNPRFL